ncbi:cytochrome c biogenesis thiol:disulfide interchange protein DsbD [Neokomagataea tanensis NBRC 106556]|uniref:Cytochrome c biogenesis thiol:disulfide interchange protein DsbD n=1 Tax=Neokomagataea tanensis NBRC 106556 TaxID=1223519 RepID=A0ABQ0QJM3_9PROT|nr:cytochrome c biogenesis thiol:disulfide interchange protein DsbD [Neokomagataea tanensis NBRC 106556]
MRNVSRFLALWAALSCGVVTSYSAHAAESAPVVSENDTASLVTDRDAVGPNQALRVGLRLQLKPGWHTYWVNPGDAGDAPTLDVTASGGAAGTGSDIHWPVPVRISEGGLMSYAYLGDVLLPETLALKGNGPVTLHAHAEWLVCAQVCVPESGDFTLSLPASSAAAPFGKDAARFDAVQAHMPVPSPFPVTLSTDGALTLSGAGLSPEAVSDAWFLPLESGVLDQVAQQRLTVQKNRLSLALSFQKNAKRDVPLSGVVVLKDAHGEESALSVTVKPGAAAQPVAASPDVVEASPGAAGWLRMMLFAFIGGLILNLMPCVFPVLAMKALSLARMGGHGRAAQLRSALFYTLGVMGSFAVLGGAMIGLRMAGSAAGWGFQFQSTGFVVAVCWLLFGMALNLLGIFEISAGRLGQIQTSGHGVGNDLMTGLLAVIVATPCTAPFMGVAITTALSGPPVMGLLVFLSMGLGLAAPYLLAAGVPGIAARFPKPGAWMNVLKQVLAFPLLATCVWLLWVAVVQRGADIVVTVAGGLVLLAIAAWLHGIGQRRAIMEGADRTVWLCRGLTALAVLGCVGALTQAVRGPAQAVAAPSQQAGIEAYTPDRLAALRAEGRPVFVDMTASWCITCMVNERVALDVASVQKGFVQNHVAYLKGDWTNRDATISAFLKEHGRDGVPLYVYYPPHGEGVVLPQILTPALVLKAITPQ